MRANTERIAAMASKLEQDVIYQARLVLLAWMGDAVDGGKATREALPLLRGALDALAAAPVVGQTLDEATRRSQVAYQAWSDACVRTGLHVVPWDKLMQDEKYQWTGVYDGCASEDNR
jgi:hypothetical protein